MLHLLFIWIKSHTGSGLKMGQGAIISGSLKQKLTASSSTTAEIYGIYNRMSFVTWCRLFFCKQVDMIEDDGRPATKLIRMLGKSNTLSQDNTSTLQLAKNGKKSCSKQT